MAHQHPQKQETVHVLGADRGWEINKVRDGAGEAGFLLPTGRRGGFSGRTTCEQRPAASEGGRHGGSEGRASPEEGEQWAQHQHSSSRSTVSRGAGGGAVPAP